MKSFSFVEILLFFPVGKLFITFLLLMPCGDLAYTRIPPLTGTRQHKGTMKMAGFAFEISSMYGRNR
jgi:hypothetical protein